MTNKDVENVKQAIAQRFKFASEKLLGETYLNEEQMVDAVQNELRPALFRSLEILFRHYPDLFTMFAFCKAGFDIQIDAENKGINMGLNKELKDIFDWVERNPDKRQEMTPYFDALAPVTHEITVSDDEVFNGRGEGVKAMINEWAKLADK